ncbi:MAG: HepT-like ribonuclease domain-containing protein [Polaromonas sp.]
MPPRDPRAFLWDVAEAARAIETFTVGMNQQSYAGSELVNAAVERKFEIIGEALNQLSKNDAAIAARIPDISKIVAFRNQLIHSYAGIDSSLVWNIAQQSLPSCFWL